MTFCKKLLRRKHKRRSQRDHQLGRLSTRRPVRFESLEGRRVLASLTGTSADDVFLVTATADDQIQVRVNDLPPTIVSDELVINAAGGNDTLEIDFSNGLIQLPIEFHGGENGLSFPGDQIVLNASAAAIEYTINAGDAGSVLVIDGEATSISYSGVEKITDNLAVQDRSVSFQGDSETITIEDDSTALDSVSTVKSTSGLSLAFAHPSDALIVRTSEDASVINYLALDAASDIPLVSIHGSDENDTFNIETPAVNTSLHLSGGGGDDELVVAGKGRRLEFDETSIGRTDALPIEISSFEHVAANNLILATASVFNTNDSGYGSLRNAIELTNSGNGGIIKFDLPVDRTHEIVLDSELPAFTNEHTLRMIARSNGGSGFFLSPSVGIDGSQLGIGADGLKLQGSGSVTLEFLAIHGFSGDGIVVGGGSGHEMSFNWIGLDTSGTPKGNQTGLRVKDVQDSVFVFSVISGNRGTGVIVEGDSTGNQVSVNRIGTTPDGMAAAGNGGNGVLVKSPNNTVNVNTISGNGAIGLSLTSEADNTTISGNQVGTDPSGRFAIGNGSHGALIRSSHNTIRGGFYPSVYSGNGRHGMVLSGSNNSIYNSFFGASAGGDEAIANQSHGLYLVNADNNLIGPPNDESEGNVFSGNRKSGIALSSSSHNKIEENKFGVNSEGVEEVGNNANGLLLQNGSTHNTIEQNQIAGNGSAGVLLSGAQTQHNDFLWNRFGSDASGTVNIPSGTFAVLIKSPSNTFEGNEIGGSKRGFVLSGTNAHGNTLSRNFIGTDAVVVADFDVTTGIQFAADARNNTVFQNVIRYTDTGIRFLANSGTGNRISENQIQDTSVIDIDLGGLGPTANDPGDVDEGANRGQNFPELDSVVFSDTEIQLTFSIPTDIANASYPIKVEVFMVSIFGAVSFLDRVSYSAADALNGVVTKVLNYGSALDATYVASIKATATDAMGNTSEVSPPISPSGGATNALNTLAQRSPLDVDANGSIAPSDALIIIDTVNGAAQANKRSEATANELASATDVNKDGKTTPADALAVINWLSEKAQTTHGREAAQLAAAIDRAIDELDDELDALGETLLF